MNKLGMFVFILLATLIGGSAFAQNGNAVVSEVQLEDLGNGTGMIVVKISGNGADNYPGGSFVISGDRIPGGTAGGGLGIDSRVFIQPPVPGNGNSNGNQQVLLAGLFPIAPGVGNGNDQVQMSFTFHPRFGNGLDWTYSRVGQLNRRPKI